MVEKEAGARSTFPYEVDSATVNFGPECRSQRASTPTAAPLACIVVNPSKPSATDAVRRRTTDVLRGAGYAGPLWLETTPAEPGTMQARLAVASGARLVVAAGGDGTVRTVAARMAGTGVDMAILPLGTRRPHPGPARLPARRRAAGRRVRNRSAHGPGAGAHRAY